MKVFFRDLKFIDYKCIANKIKLFAGVIPTDYGTFICYICYWLHLFVFTFCLKLQIYMQIKQCIRNYIITCNRDDISLKDL